MVARLQAENGDGCRMEPASWPRTAVSWWAGIGQALAGYLDGSTAESTFCPAGRLDAVSACKNEQQWGNSSKTREEMMLGCVPKEYLQALARWPTRSNSTYYK